METTRLATQRPLLLIRQHIEDILQQAAEHLNQYHDDTSNKHPLELCQELLHQVSGSLTMLELPGATALASEMETLVKALGESRDTALSGSIELLLAASLFLPRYLNYVQRHGRETPALLLPTINLLRCARRAGLIPEHAFVSHHLPVFATPLVGTPQAPHSELPQRIRRLRHMYQVGLLGVINKRASNVHLHYLRHAIARIEKLCGHQPKNELWKLTSGLLTAVTSGAVTLDTSVKYMLGVVDRQIRDLASQGPGFLAEPLDTAVRDHLLYYIAKAMPEGQQIVQLQRRYRLAGVVPDDAFLTEERRKLQAPDQITLRAVASQLGRNLDHTKVMLMQLAPHGDRADADSEALLENLHQIALTLDMLDLGVALGHCRAITNRLRNSNHGDTGPDAVSEMAEHLVAIESDIRQFAAGIPAQQLNPAASNDFREGEIMALDEARTALGHVKTTLDDYIDPHSSRHGEASEIAPLVALAGQVAGALEILQLGELSRSVTALGRYVDRQLSRSRQPGEAELDALADAFASIEWFLEDYETHRGEGESALEITRKSLEALQPMPAS